MIDQKQAALKLPPEPSCTWYEPYAGPGDSLVTYRVCAVGKSFLVKWLDGDDWIPCTTPAYGMNCIVHRAWTREVERLYWWVEGWGRYNQRFINSREKMLPRFKNRGYEAQRRHRNAEDQQTLWEAALKAAERNTE